MTVSVIREIATMTGEMPYKQLRTWRTRRAAAHSTARQRRRHPRAASQRATFPVEVGSVDSSHSAWPSTARRRRFDTPLGNRPLASSDEAVSAAARWPSSGADRPSADRRLPWAAHLRPAGVGQRSRGGVFLRAKYQDSDRDMRVDTVYTPRSEIRRIIVRTDATATLVTLELPAVNMHARHTHYIYDETTLLLN